MIYLVTALMIEASPFINKYKLKKDMGLNEFQVFRSDEVVLIITGVGKIKAAMGLVYLFSQYGITRKDIVVNIGLCGSLALPVGTLIIADKITDHDTKRDYYPDILTEGFMRRKLVCYSHVVSKDEITKDDIIVDMESAGIMEAAYKFVNAHQIVVCKIVSDNLSDKPVDTMLIQSVLNRNLSHVDSVINMQREAIFSDNIIDINEDEEYIKTIIGNLRLTDALSDILRANVRRAKIRGFDTKSILSHYMDLTSNTKDERKRIFDELSKALNQGL